MKAGLVFSCFGTLLLAACGPHEKPATRADGPAVPVHVAVTTLARIPALLEIPATVRPAERAIIASKLTGTVASFPLGLGGKVAAGDVILTLSVPDIDASLHRAQAQLAEATRLVERERTLAATGANAADSLRDAKDRLRIVQAAATEAEAMLAYATIRAPFAGVITEKNVLTGDLATPGRPLLTLESTARLRAEGAIPESAANRLHAGDFLAVSLGDGSAPVRGQIEEISGAADPVSRSVLVKVALPDGSAHSGQFARLQVDDGTTDALLIPKSAVTRFGQMERVFVVAQGRAVLRLVKTGRVADGPIEILAGLNAGEQVVLTPSPALRDGQPVSVAP
ncbi:MAG: efflux RND transporter periplasmic adaptor subunit [Lacunisphaera sp.]